MSRLRSRLRSTGPRRSLAVLHGIELTSSVRDTKKWRKSSYNQRKKVAKDTGLMDGSKNVEVTDELVEYLNRKYPERSFSAEEPLARLRAEVAEVKERDSPE